MSAQGVLRQVQAVVARAHHVPHVRPLLSMFNMLCPHGQSGGLNAPSCATEPASASEPLLPLDNNTTNLNEAIPGEPVVDQAAVSTATVISQPVMNRKMVPNYLVPGTHTKKIHITRIKRALLSKHEDALEQPSPAEVLVGSFEDAALKIENRVPEEVLAIARSENAFGMDEVQSTISFEVNGVTHTTDAAMDPRTLLVHFLRDNLGKLV